MKKFICPVCGYIHVGDATPERCPICKVPGYRFSEQKSEGETTDAAIHHPSNAQNVSKDVNEEAHQDIEKYYYVDANHKQAGPVCPTDFIKLGINKGTLVWQEGMDDWQPAGQLPELAPYLKQIQQSSKTTPPPINPQQKSNNYMVWAILSTVFGCLATGITAIYYANKGETLRRERKKQDSIEAMKKARLWIIVSISIGLIGYIILALYGPSGFFFFQLLMLTLWFTYTIINGVGAGASSLFAILLWVGGIIFLCWIIPILFSICFSNDKEKNNDDFLETNVNNVNNSVNKYDNNYSLLFAS